jgi:hypothetical protein
MRAINPTVNNSANYLKRLPFVSPTEAELDTVNSLLDRVLASRRADDKPDHSAMEALEHAIADIWNSRCGSSQNEVQLPLFSPVNTAPTPDLHH